MQRFNASRIDKESFGVISIIDILENFGLKPEEQLRFLDQIVDHREYRDDFRKNRKWYLRLGDSENDWEGLRNEVEGEIVYSLLKMRSNIIRKYGQMVRLYEKEGELYNDVNDLIHSVIHLHLNRLIGTDREKEKKIMTLARHTLRDLEYFRKTK
ncbi:thiopeptide-type bacteriocin biosynthesis domain-containing protein [Thermoflavimicrobium dichotomicum]|uniref:Thiopeptide-type bacteriocin biosynthesis domain-containing protein n=1 Tax=Thermoflavimicrobium dichotomicum TaxID=46223 RepID=A0A1I3RDS3_9BACL|nr:thiopeptide-type bacteriocin biosynthesis domain-containing protein [Thermoflavimicrobium dichotomicum]